MMSDIFSTSCSYKPKEYDPEHEVCLKGILLSTQEKKKKSRAFLLPPTPDLIHMGVRHPFWLECLAFILRSVKQRSDEMQSRLSELYFC